MICEQIGGIKGKENRNYRSTVPSIPEALEIRHFFGKFGTNKFIRSESV